MAAGRAAAAAGRLAAGAASGRLAAGAAAGRLAAFVGRLSPAGLVSKRNACTEVDLKKATALTEEISKVLKEPPSEMAPAKIRGLVEELSKACGHPSIENSQGPLPIVVSIPKEGIPISAVTQALPSKLEEEVTSGPDPKPEPVSLTPKALPSRLEKEVTAGPDPKPEPVSLTPKGGWFSGWSFWSNERA